MSKPGRDRANASTDGSDRPAAKTRRRAARERRALEAKLADADRLIAKRTAQLGDASSRRTKLVARLARLPADETGGPTAYCLKDRVRVTVRDPRPMVLANGRSAIGGTCPICRSKVVWFGGA